MIESYSDIRAQIQRLLKAAGVGDKLPTPKEEIVECSKLVEIEQLNLFDYKNDWKKRGFKLIKRALSKIKGLVDFKHEIIYVDPNIHPAKRSFVTFHEVSHRILPWQKDLFCPHADTEYSLDPRIEQIFEVEANIGASLILFQIDRFKRELKDLKIGLGSAMKLAERFDASLHSTFRKYVEDNHRACTLLVLKSQNHNISNKKNFFNLWYYIQSEKFTKEYGHIDWPKFYHSGDPIYDTISTNSLKPMKHGEMTMKNLSGYKKKCRIETFYNQFNHFVLIYPIRRFVIGKKKVILRRK